MITNSELDQIAVWEMAQGISAHVEGMKGFAASYLKDRTGKQRRLLTRYNARKDKLTGTFIAKAKAEGWDKPAPQIESPTS